MSKVFVFLEGKDGKLKKGSIELLSWAKANGLDTSAGAIGPDASELAKQAGAFGAKKAFACTPGTAGYNPEIYVSVLKNMISSCGAQMVLANASALAKDAFPRVAARMDSSVASDCTNIRLDGEKLIAVKPLYAGKCSAEVEFESGLSIVLMRSNQLPVLEGEESAAEVESITPPEASGKVTLTDTIQGTSNRPDLTEANVIVSGGRGMGEAKNFEVLEDLASTLGATVGASRAVVDSGWVPHGMQVGQTGKTVSPSLYIACGISGAIQHMAGMSGSKVIVAINKDPDAPIFQKASYGIVGDIFELAGPLKEELNKVLN